MTDVIDKERRFGSLIYLFPLAIALGLFYLSGFLPIVGLFVPVPLYYSLVINGQKVGSYTILIAAAITLSIGGLYHAVFFLISCGMMAWILALAFTNKFSLEATVASASSIPFLCAMILLVASSTAGDGEIFSPLAQWGQSSIDSVLATYKSMDADPEVVSWISDNSALFVDLFVRLFPSLFFLSLMFMVMMNLLAIRIFSIKRGFGIHPKEHALCRWLVPDWFVWFVVAGGFGTVLFSGTTGVISINMLIVAVTAYLVQGIAVMHFFFLKSAFPAPLLAIGYFFIFSQPVLITGAIILGLVEVWADFRKLEAKTSSNNSVQ